MATSHQQSAPLAVRIRPATPADAQKWESLRRALWPEDPESHALEIAQFFAGTLHEPDAVYLAEDAAQSTVALLELSIRHDVPGLEGRRTGYVEGLYVVPERRHRGIARQLVEFSQAWARENHCDSFASDRADRIVIHRAFSAR